jgi:hypothetical protein
LLERMMEEEEEEEEDNQSCEGGWGFVGTIFLLLPSKGKFSQYSTLSSWFHNILFHGIHILGWKLQCICLRVCWAKNVSLKNLCSRKYTSTLYAHECWKQHSIPSPCISHNNFCSITQPIGVGCYPPSWLSSLLKEMWAFTTHEGDLRFYTIPCRHSRFHHMWRKPSITHLFVVICHQFGFHHLGRKCLSMHLLGVIC